MIAIVKETPSIFSCFQRIEMSCVPKKCVHFAMLSQKLAIYFFGYLWLGLWNRTLGSFWLRKPTPDVLWLYLAMLWRQPGMIMGLKDAFNTEMTWWKFRENRTLGIVKNKLHNPPSTLTCWVKVASSFGDDHVMISQTIVPKTQYQRWSKLEQTRCWLSGIRKIRW